MTNMNYNGESYHSLEEVVAAYYNKYINKEIVVAEGAMIHTLQHCPLFILDRMIIAGMLEGQNSVYYLTDYGKEMLVKLLDEMDVYELELTSLVEKESHSKYEAMLDKLLESAFFDNELGNGCKFSFDKVINKYDNNAYQFVVENGVNYKHHIDYLFSLIGVDDLVFYDVTDNNIVGSFSMRTFKYIENYNYIVGQLNKMK